MRRNALTVCFVVALVALLGNVSSATTTENVVYSFAGQDGVDPAADLVFDAAGNAYGTTVSGGGANCGTVFKLTPSGSQWLQTVLFSFDCFGSGKNPYGGVTLDAQGNLYGTTVAGGSGGVCAGDGCGVVYKLTHSGGSWTETVLYSFGDAPDAGGPGSAVVFDRAGNILGTAPDGGAFAHGAVYELTFNGSQWTERVLHDFSGGADGAVGFLGRLLPDAVGNFYGVTELGGANGLGTVFKLAPMSGSYQLTTLYAFTGSPDGAFPYGGLVADRSGNLYGTTYFGGSLGQGSVFRVGPGPVIGGWRDAVLYSFQGGTDGANPTGTLLFDANGNLYGTTSAGGDASCQCGSIFTLTPTGVNRWTLTWFHDFAGSSDGKFAYYGLTPDGQGHYLGTTANGGTHNMGAIFSVTP